MKFTVKKNKWLHGNSKDDNSKDSQLRDSYGFMCCMGFRELKKGRRVSEILGKEYPSDCHHHRDDWIYTHERAIASINDCDNIDDLESEWNSLIVDVPELKNYKLKKRSCEKLREEILTAIFKYFGDQIVFED